MNVDELTKSVNQISETPFIFIDVFKINSQSKAKDKLERFYEFNNKDVINRMASAEVKTFIKQYLCCSDENKVPKYCEHERIATFAFKYFTAEEIFVLLDKCYKEFPLVSEKIKNIVGIQDRMVVSFQRLPTTVIPEISALSAFNQRLPTSTIPALSAFNDPDLCSSSRMYLDKTIDKPLAELKAFIFILELIRIKCPELEDDIFNEYIQDLKNKFKELLENHQFDILISEFLKNAKVKIDNLKSNSVVILEFSDVEKNKKLVKRTSDYISKVLNVPVVAIPEKMKLHLVEDSNEDNSIDGLEV
jgi:hypothetical protein